MGDQRAAVGRFGEEVARRFLEGQGFAILETNWPLSLIHISEPTRPY